MTPEQKIDHIQKECSKSNWDSYGAAPIREATCELARKMLPYVRQVCGDDFSVSPSPAEYIEFEGIMPSGDEFTIEVYMERLGPTGSPRL